MNRAKITARLSERFICSCRKLGLSELEIDDSFRWETKIYAANKHALLLLVDWYDCDVCVYLVRLIDRALPGKEILHTYPDGTWCRIPLAKFLQKKPPERKVADPSKWTDDVVEDHFEMMLDFYIQLMESNHLFLQNFLDTGEV